LEATDWSCDDNIDIEYSEDEESEEEDFALMITELQRTGLDVRQALYNIDGGSKDTEGAANASEEKQVEELEMLMRKMVAVKGLLLGQRKNAHERGRLTICRNDRGYA
jgi:hypothetical protein